MYRVLWDQDGFYTVIFEDPGVVYPIPSRKSFEQIGEQLRGKLLYLRMVGPGFVNDVGEMVSENEFLIYW